MTDHPLHSYRPAAAATLTDPRWRNAPTELDPEYFRVWQRVSLALQRSVRDNVAAAYFANPATFEDRQAAYPVIVYQASRLCHGRPRTEFTYDLRDYPECRTTLISSWKMTGRAIQALLRGIESRLNDAGMAALAHRYAPVWHQDVLVAVQKKPRTYVELLMAESAVINAVIDLGTERSIEAANRFAKTVHLNLRKLCGMDLQRLGVSVLEEATRVLAQNFTSCADDGRNIGTFQNSDPLTAGSPDSRIAGKEDRDYRRAHGSGQMRDAGVVADVDTGRRDPAGQFI